MTETRNSRRRSISFVAIAFLCFLVWRPLVATNVIIDAFYYNISILFAGLGICSLKLKIQLRELLFILLLVISGVININAVGNLTWPRQMHILVSFFTSFILLNNSVYPSPIRNLIYINCIVVLSLMAFQDSASIYASLSNNYISVYCIYLAVYYYTIAENCKILPSVIPALITFVISVLAQGRGGMLASFLLLFFVFIVVLIKGISNRYIRLLCCCIFLSFVACLVLYLIQNMSCYIHNPLLSHFAKRGFGSIGRSRMLEEYILCAISSTKAFILGYNFNMTTWISAHGGNPHNSIIEIHGLHGGITFVVLICMLIKSYKWGWEHKRWMYVIGISVLLIRGFTDRMLWGTDGTALFFFFLLIPYHWDRKKQCTFRM